MNQSTHHQIAKYLTDYALSELVKYVMEDTGCSIEEAMERVYYSPLMTALQDEDNELYVQSPAYLYELMEHTQPKKRYVLKAISHPKVWPIQKRLLPLHPREPAKPLHDAQMCGSFYFYTMSNRIPFQKPSVRCSPTA